MQAALELARASAPLSPPNPAVGCVLVSPDGEVIGTGRTDRVGGPHAEARALADMKVRGHSGRDATAYVTLEPCSHFGRTPPCADALVREGVRRVVVATQDPNPLVAGRGIERLRAAGIEVSVGLLEEASREVNPGFFSRMTRGLPWVRLKVAASLDGRTALQNGASQWITGTAARVDGHRWRARAGAILTGIGTVLDDDPRLDVREVEAPRQPLRVVLDSQLRTPAHARLLQVPGSVLVYAAQDHAERRAALQAAGAEVVVLPATRGRVDLSAMLRDLAARQVNDLHVEAGHRLNGALVEADLVDEFLVYLAPKLIGLGREMMQFGPLAALGEARALEFIDVERLGDDLRLRARRRERHPD
ncbi:bifunctional diaminohydroxyphosphoribosylaminopyrimidine deaminase/5-amino-6-(5-phosphoribosylamino)uracil reductase RibD [Eleftheria terrae]|uniref:bifunctional diaminohydroxyphosphoribosylaminopyrimidine deaminase/5-amino-6-(5-phosphoribosylamino)uracil reductase RibD n=1 Tax=Eleftheria terrae TaxID=1597781 RepID=UPI00263A4AD2|nr:bifunctional diaminohydroxyphosphoribosylaminopyrimidine deaminase/5-amino-6-(5-phosphoribosylamino)uracil reductase RibD [Eleftheria terrae]WKB52416.1 bifunctional diaminohydroxyphosphoribosylaminopyrimidine deaminase/5-amino-6-(5-phosphoribosylamino)uracil reductase RibD [Eleftheria terrae]